MCQPIDGGVVCSLTILFQCQQKGHWANGMLCASHFLSHFKLPSVLVCPNEPSDNKRSRSFGTNSKNQAAADTCFKCHKSGHYANGLYFNSLTCKLLNPHFSMS